MGNLGDAPLNAPLDAANTSGGWETGDFKIGGYRTPGTGWLLCDGSAVSRTTYAALFAKIVPSLGTFTVTIASPAVVTLSSHSLNTGDAVYLTTTGALPTGLTANTLYYVIWVSSSTFRLATTRANALAGTAINTSGSQSGTHTLRFCPFGLGDGSTTFNVPDPKGRSLVGIGTGDATGATAHVLGQKVGEEAHTLTTGELPPHTHTINSTFNASALGDKSRAAHPSNTGTDTTLTSSNGPGASTPFDVQGPGLGVNVFIKT